MFHIDIGEKGLLYPEVYDHVAFRSANLRAERTEFLHKCVEKNGPILVEVIEVFPIIEGVRIDEFLRVYSPDHYSVSWFIPSSFLKLTSPRR